MNIFPISSPQISSSRSTSATRAFECETKAADGISISSSTLDPKLEEVVVSQETSMSRSDVRKSKSKVRSYLKKCKDALYGHSTDETCSITVNEDLPQSSNTSWYLTATATPMESIDSANTASSDQLPKAMKTNQVDEQEAIDNEIKCISMTETVPPVESQVNKVKEILEFSLHTKRASEANSFELTARDNFCLSNEHNVCYNFTISIALTCCEAAQQPANS